MEEEQLAKPNLVKAAAWSVPLFASFLFINLDPWGVLTNDWWGLALAFAIFILFIVSVFEVLEEVVAGLRQHDVKEVYKRQWVQLKKGFNRA